MLRLIKRIHEWGNKHEWLLILLLSVVVLRLPSLCTPHYYGDEEIYFVMGRAWANGVPLYHAMFDHKPPLIYILAGLTKTVFYFRFSLLISMLIHTVFFWKLARLFWAGKREKMAYLSSAAFVLLTSLPTFEGLIVNAELLMMLPLTLSLLLIWDIKDSAWLRYLVAGLVGGVGWLYKIPVVFDAVAIVLYLFIFREKKFSGSIKALFKPGLWLYLAGFALPLAATFGYYYLKGHGTDYLATVLTVNLGYVSSWTTGAWNYNPLKSGLMTRGMALGGFTLILYVLRHKLDKRLILASLWFAFSLFGALLSARPYPHYLQQPVVPFSLLWPFLFVAERVWEWLIVAMLAGAAIVSQRSVKFGAYPTVPVYQNFGRYITGKISKAEYYEKFDNVKRNYTIAKYLNERLAPEQMIFVWGSDPTIYNLTNRIPSGGKYMVSFHVRDLKQTDYTFANIQKNRPKAIVVLDSGGEFPQLMKLIELSYIEVLKLGEDRVYWRIENK